MRRVIVQTAIIFSFAVCAFAAEQADVKALVSESFHISSQYNEIREQMKAATDDLDKQLKQIRNKITWLKKPPFDEKRIRGTKSNITFAKNQIDKHEALIELAKVTDPAERAKLVEKYEAERKKETDKKD